jgi:DNA-binding SARP family transcriptional activator
VADVLFRLFGEISLYADGRKVDLGNSRERCMLAALLLVKGRAVPRQNLPDWIWDRIPQSAFADIDQFMTRLRTRLNGAGLDHALKNKDGLCRLDIPPDFVDVHRFRSLVEDARGVDDPHAAALLHDALELSAEELLAGLNGRRISNYRYSLGEERHVAELALVEIELRLGHAPEVIVRSSRLFDDRPEDAAVARVHMLALHLAGRPVEALSVYDKLRERLAAIGLDVPKPVRDLHVQILRDDDGLRTAVSALPIPQSLPGSPRKAETLPEVLPVRAAELDAARQSPNPPHLAEEVLAARHLVVLVGDPHVTRATALRLLTTTPNGLTVLDVVKYWHRPSVAVLPQHDARGYLLNLNDPVTDQATTAFAEDLAALADRLVDRGSYLVVTVRPELWWECWLAAADVTVRLDAAAPPDDYHQGVYLHVRDPDGTESVFALRNRATARTRVSLGRKALHEPPPDIALDSDTPSPISRLHAWLVYGDRTWTLVRAGLNPPRIRLRGTTEDEPVEDRTTLRNGDVIVIAVGAAPDGRSRCWELEFRDSQDTTTYGGNER